MSISHLKLMAGLMVAIGVGVCATFGAQLTPKTLHAVTVELAKSNQIPIQSTDRSVEIPSERVSAWWSMSAIPFCGGLLLILLGSGLARSAQTSALKNLSTESGTQSLSLQEGLELIINELTELQRLLDGEQRGPNLIETKQRLESLQMNTLEPLVDQRDRFRLQMGILSFVDVFGPFSQGERRLNRAWAACVDQHYGEVTTCVGLARSSFEQALQSQTSHT
jgi:hypothetical protein